MKVCKKWLFMQAGLNVVLSASRKTTQTISLPMWRFRCNFCGSCYGNEWAKKKTTMRVYEIWALWLNKPVADLLFRRAAEWTHETWSQCCANAYRPSISLQIELVTRGEVENMQRLQQKSYFDFFNFLPFKVNNFRKTNFKNQESIN